MEKLVWLGNYQIHCLLDVVVVVVKLGFEWMIDYEIHHHPNDWIPSWIQYFDVDDVTSSLFVVLRYSWMCRRCILCRLVTHT